MPWLKMLHIVALLVWCGALLYLPAAIAARTGRAGGGLFHAPHREMARHLYTLVATPAALLAIASGTAIFLANLTLGGWLVAKLTAVTALVACHALLGLLILRAERHIPPDSLRACVTLGALSAGLIVLIAWLVLGKPF